MENQIIISSQSKRILWIDYAKLIGIYLVILGHLNLRSNGINAFINSFHMQLFFLLSGICFNKDDFFNILKKSCRGLLIPYVFFYTLCYPYWVAKSYFRDHLEITVINYVVKPFFGFLYGVVYDTKYSFMVIVAGWFLLALFFIRLFATIILKLPNPLKLVSVVGCVTLGLLLNYLDIMLPFSINVSLLCVPIFLCGYYAKDIIMQFISISAWSKLIIISVGVCCLYTLSNENGMFHVGDGVFGNIIWLYYINALLGGGIVVLIASLFTKENRFLIFLSKNTLIIMFFEVYAFAPFKILMQRIFSAPSGTQDYIPLLAGIIIALISLLVCVIPCYVINKWFPYFIGRKKTK